MLAFIAFNFWDTGYRINLADSNMLITYSGLGATTIIVLSAFFMMPTYRKIYKDFWGLRIDGCAYLYSDIAKFVFTY